MKEFNVVEHNNSINRIYSTYPTNKIVKMGDVYCKVN